MENPTSRQDRGSTTRSDAAQRGASPVRVLIVRDEGLCSRVQQVFGSDDAATVVRVPSFLAAMGDLAHHHADAVIGPVDAITGMLESTGQALRELAPDARLVVTAHAAERETAHEALGAGFDAALIEPYDGPELAAALQLAWQPDSAPSFAGHRSYRQPPQPPAAQSPTQERESPAPRLAEEQLGDADLIDHLLAEGRQLPQYLAAMIAAQSGIAGVQLHLTGRFDPVPQSMACIDVAYSGRTLGVLVAPPPATAAQLRPWAAWAARWLAMADRLARLQDMALRDELTGVWNRRYFNRFLKRILERAHSERQQVTLMVFDIDDFKLYNDRYGHAAGDEILRESARLMTAAVREHDVVARIGGDEFAVIFWDADEPRRQGSKHPNDVLRAARRFQKAICEHKFPKLLDDAMGTLTISAGLASYPWDGQTPEELLARADSMAMQSKQQGKNALTLGHGAAQFCDPREL